MRIRVSGIATCLALALLAPGLSRAETAPIPWLGEGFAFAASSAHRQPEPTTPRRARLRRQRPNTISLGIQGQFGAVRGNSRIADGFDQGLGYALRFRYMLSPSSALAFSFENHRYGSIETPNLSDPEFPDSHVVVTTVAVEAVFYGHRERELNPYVLGGIGFATPDVVYTDIEGRSLNQAARVNEGLFAVVGVGFERFIRPRLSADVTIRGYALVSNSEFTSMGQVSVGIHLYPGD